jgi:hypothetical protein
VDGLNEDVIEGLENTASDEPSCKYTVKKGSRVSLSPAGMSLTKLPLGGNNSVMTSLFPPRESLVVTSQLGTGNSRTFFLRCMIEEFEIRRVNEDVTGPFETNPPKSLRWMVSMRM